MDDKTENLKLFAIIFVLIQTVISGMIPIYWGRRAFINPQVISVGNCFTAGIFLAMALGHILYEARETEESIEHYHVLSGKLHLHIFIGTFVLIFGIEAIISSEENQENKSPSFNQALSQDKEAPIELELIDPKTKTLVSLQKQLVEEESSQENSKKSTEHSFVNFVLITGAMSIHSISTGLALGVQQEYKSVISILFGKCR
jgi:zinc transporter ZupT